MEFNNPSEIVKNLTFGSEASNKIMTGVDKLTSAVKSTLGASGKCVIYEDALFRPIITKDGVTVAQSVVLLDPVENMGATLIKEAANNTVRKQATVQQQLLSLPTHYLNKQQRMTIKKRLEALKMAFQNVVKKFVYILTKPACQLKAKCYEASLLLAAITTATLEIKLERLTRKLEAMESF